MSESRANTIADITYQSPGSVYPQVRAIHTMDHTTDRPFPQAVVYPNRERMTRPMLFPQIDASRGMTHLKYVKPDNGFNMIPAMKEVSAAEDIPAALSTASQGLGMPAKVLIGIGLIIAVIVLVEYNR